MERDVEKRLADLEEEVRSLRMELNELTANKTHAAHESMPGTVAKAADGESTPEKHLLTLNKKALSSNKETPISIKPNRTAGDKETAKEPAHRSFEEVFLWLLPKVFMLILVLGVLWGLKVISDIGMLTNGVKIMLAYLLSVGLVIIAYLMDRKRPESSRIYTVVLYGGAFIIGILTTAAGAILYAVLPLYTALLLALVYIAYGIIICYVKKNEVLSIFVLFASLLLPYLLEYMDFNGAIIVLYVLVVYSSMQWIFTKHGQSTAMYCSYFFSVAALFIIWSFNEESAWLYTAGLLLLNILFLLVWWRLYKPYSKRRTIHEGLLFSLSVFTVVLINFIAEEAAGPLLALLIAYSAMAVYALKRQENRVMDILATLALLVVINIVLDLELAESLELLLLPFAAFSGLILALKLDAIFMKAVYSVVFAINIIAQIMIYEVQPFWTAEHLNYLVIMLYLVILFWFFRFKNKPQRGTQLEANTLHLTVDIFPVLAVLYFFIYFAKIDLAYLSNDRYPYAAMLLLALVMLLSFFVSENLIGRALRYMLIIAFALAYINLLPTHFVQGFDIWLNLFVRFIYVLILIAVVADLFKKGFLYRSWLSKTKINVDTTVTLGIVFSMILMYSILEQAKFEKIISPLFAITMKTLLLFLTATASLWISAAEQYRKVRITGYCLIAIAMFKLFFFDLDSLDLIIRAVLFMLIGAVGLLLSNRLLTKNSQKK